MAGEVCALIFDCDGVLADTERDGHLPAFNAMFEEVGLPFQWSVADYAELVRIGGGKERLASVLTPRIFAEHLRKGETKEEALARWHAVKSRHFQELVRQGHLPARPGIARLITEALEKGWRVAVASTSAEESVRAVLESAVGTEFAARVRIFAGDIVAAKKPAPDIYEKALEELGMTADNAVAVEDSGQGCAAAVAAGLPVIVTVSRFTREDDFGAAALVVSDLGDVGRPCEVLDDSRGVMAGKTLVTLETVRAVGRFNAK